MMRWLKFNLVGVMGMGIQLGSLALLVHVLGLHYLLATALAVEAAVLHNFLWHRRWTWADRKEVQSGSPVAMLLRFNLTNGLVSIAGNLLFMRVLAGAAGLEPVAANLLSIALCSLANFLLADRFVFVPTAFRVRGDKTQRGLHRCSGKSPRVTKRPFAIPGAGKARMQCVQGKEKPADFSL